MSGGMPYQLEKGPVLRVVEQHLNGTRAEMRAVLDRLRASEEAERTTPGLHDVSWVDAVPGLWDDPAFDRRPPDQPPPEDHIKRDWFGYRKVDGAWVWQDTVDTGFWLGYRGKPDRIVRAALRWAHELALGVPPDGDGPGRDKPWQIELFWKCMSQWFETWVVHRPVGPTGLVSVFLLTPSHRGSNIAESPIAGSPTTLAAGAGHPVPSTQDDYQILVGADPGDPKPLHPVEAIERRYGTWVVTHRQHRTAEVVPVANLTATNNVGPTDFRDWGIPQFCRYEGKGDIVVVSPSMAAGGMKHDGSV